MTSNTKNSVIKLRLNKKSYGEIAKELGLSKSTVASFIKEHDITGSRFGTCPECGKNYTFTTGHRVRKFCCEKCRRKWWKKHEEQRKQYTIVCECCGKTFQSPKAKRKYCSRECFIAARYGK